MSISKGEALEVARLANEVCALAALVVAELDSETRWSYDERKDLPVWPGGLAPDHAYNMTGSKATGALRRRSMDLTRALAEMRKS